MNKNIKYYEDNYKNYRRYIAADTSNPVRGHYRCVIYTNDEEFTEVRTGDIIHEDILSKHYTEIDKAEFMTAVARITFDIEQKAGIAEGL